MSEWLKIIRDALPEALGGLAVATIVGILGLIYRNLSRNKSKKRAESKPSSISNLLSANSDKQETIDKNKILFVDDELAWYSVILTGIEKYGYEIIPATNVGQAVEIIKSENLLALAIIDLMIPSGDQKEGRSKYQGLRVIEVAKQLRPEMPIICHSAAARGEIIERLQELGVNEILPKPIGFDEFTSRVKLVLLSSQRPKQQELLVDEIKRRKLELKAGSSDVRIKALWTLGELGQYDPSILTLIKELEVNDKDSEVRKAANQAKRKIHKSVKQQELA